MQKRSPYLRVSTDEIKKKKSKWLRCGACCCFVTWATVLILIGIAGLVMWLVAPWIFGPCPYEMHTTPSVSDTVISTIAWGSCADNEDSLSILNDIRDADVFVFLGDNVYADTSIAFIMRMIYNRLSCKPAFQSLVKTVKYVLATWDDHDYGTNDGGKDYAMKHESKSIFTDFFRLNNDRANRKDGVYGSYQFQSMNGSVAIILLDLRFNRDPLNVCSNVDRMRYEATGSGPWFYCPHTKSEVTILGEAQWKWLTAELERSQRENALTIIGSSIQFATEANGFETWANFPSERDKLIRLIDPLKTIVISGDVHMAEFSVLENNLIDATSSGISNVANDIKPNKYRFGNVHATQNYGVINLDSKKITIYGKKNVVLETMHYFNPN